MPGIAVVITVVYLLLFTWYCFVYLLLYLLCFSGSEACWRHPAGRGHPVRPVEERDAPLPPNPLQPLPQDQRQARWNQQHTGTKHQVRAPVWNQN